MAHIDYKDGVFWGIATYAERGIFQHAGWVWSPRRRSWITDSLAVADNTHGLTWTDAAIRHIEKREKLAAISHALSYSAESDYEPPIPQALLDKGWDFKPFQKAGVEYSIQPGRKDILIADQPGLGKTIQAIGVSNAFPKRRRVLVVVPASLKENWRREWRKWDSKGMSVGIAETRYREKFQDGFYKNGNPRWKTVVHPTWWPDTEVVIINYDILEKFSTQINEHVWDILICDECHALKTPDSGRTLFVLGPKSAKMAGLGRKKFRDAAKAKPPIFWNPIEAKRRIFLSGTPMMNRPVELWPIVQAFDPDGLGKNYESFGYTYCDGYFDASRGNFGAYDFTGASNQEELGRKLREKFMIRRLKREVLPELPLKFRQVILMDSPEIREVVAREDELAQALKLYEASFVTKIEDEEERDVALGRQIMDQAYKFGFHQSDDPDRPNSRAINLEYAAAVLGLEPPAVAVMFEEMAAVRRELGLAKLTAVIPWIKNFLDGGEKLLIFAYHSDVVLGIVEGLAEYNPAYIYGGTPLKKRQGQVDKFQDDESCRAFVGNLQAAGVGFTLTRAADVAFAEGDWTPTLLEQAEDRACRIGQTAEKIMSFFLVANGSLDSRIAQASKEKEDNINRVLDT